MGGSLEDLVTRFRDLEVSQARLREQLQLILGKGRKQQAHDLGPGTSRRGRGGGEVGSTIPGRFAHGPYRSVLKHIGHALHIYRPDTGEIIFWNQSAENLYGWKDHEALGKRVGDLLIQEGSNPHLGKVMEQLNRGQPWSGQLALKKKSGEMLTAMVTKTPLYEDGSFVGVIAVSSDAAVLNAKYSETMEGRGDQVRDKPRVLKRVHWCQRPQLASSVSNLALRVFSRSHSCSDSEHEASQEGNAKPKKKHQHWRRSS
ncbi:uncharacterized protein LOC103985701 [Musa acuminata AAA Group]|uniref:uncharacterized protein LOC103985701 n=1 Tax=Musa acuminata AAA Group TaxID=214697 RepID=UPI0031D91D2B